jgi:uncharacterized protein
MKMKHLKILTALLLLCGGSLSAETFAETQADLPKLKLKSGGKVFEVPMAITPDQRAIGLMNRSSLGEDEGMLFVFESPQPVAFWMKNTLIPLSIAYISSTGTVLEIYDLKPLSEEPVPSFSKSVLYALEMSKGWFERNGIQPGANIEGLPLIERKADLNSQNTQTTPQ